MLLQDNGSVLFTLALQCAKLARVLLSSREESFAEALPVSDSELTGRVSLKRQNYFLRPGDLTPTVFRYEETKKPISNV